MNVCDLIRRRLGISLVIDTIEEFSPNMQYCIQAIAFFRELIKGKHHKTLFIINRQLVL